MLFKGSSLFFLLAAMASVSLADSRLVVTPNTKPGHTIFDLYLNAPVGDSIGALQILLEPDPLNTGKIYQFPIVPSDVRPSAGLVGVFPDAQFDTFVAAGTAIDGATPLIFGASDMLGGPGGQADLGGATRLDATFSPAAGQDTLGAQDFLAARVVLTHDYAGVLTLFADFVQATGENPQVYPIFPIFKTPEPATTWLAGAAIATAGFRRRRRARIIPRLGQFRSAKL